MPDDRVALQLVLADEVPEVVELPEVAEAAEVAEAVEVAEPEFEPEHESAFNSMTEQ